MREFLKNVALVAIVICGIFVVMFHKDMLISLSKPVDINVDYPDDYSDVKAVDTELSMIVDLFAEEEITTTSSGAITDVDYVYYYIVPVYTESEEDPYFVGLKVDGEDRKEYEDVMDATWDYMDGLSEELLALEFQGGFKKMEDEAYKYFVEWFEDAEWYEDEDDLEKYVLPLILEPIDLASVKKSIFVLGSIILVSIVVLIWASRPKKEKKIPAPQKSIITINGVNYPISNFENVNKLVVSGKKDKAVKELMSVVAITETDAESVIASWDSYWY